MESDVEISNCRANIQKSAVFLLATLYMLPISYRGFNVYDEGIRLYGAMRVTEGATPYRDFFAIYAPAQFYWPAVLFKILGPQVLVFRANAVFFIGVAAVALFTLIRHANVKPIWALMPVLALLLPLNRGDVLFSCDPALSLVLSAGALVTGTWTKKRSFLTGTLIGLAALFRQDFGFYGMLATAFTALARGFRLISAHHQCFLKRIEIDWTQSQIVSLIIGCLVVSVPFYLCLFFATSPSQLYESLVSSPAMVTFLRRQPYNYEFDQLCTSISDGISGVATSNIRQFYWRIRGGVFPWAVIGGVVMQAGRILVFLTAPLALFASLALVIHSIRKEFVDYPGRIFVVFFLVLSGIGFSIYGGSVGSVHLFPLHVIAASFIIVILSIVLRMVHKLIYETITKVFLFAAACMVIIMLAASLSVSYSPLNLVNTIGLRVSEDTVWLEDAVRDIKAVNSGSHIFVAGTRHDRVFVSAVAIYFLAGRISGTYYHDFYPGITTTAEVQQRIVADLNANDVRTVLVWKDPLPALPNNISSGVRILDDFLQSNFERIRASKRYDLLVRKASIDSVLR